jgi:hypothetical protein
MRALLIPLVVAGVTLAHASDAMRVDGVPVYGRVHDVELVDIRAAIKVGASHGSVFKVEVLGPADINVHLRNLGYIALRRFAGIQYDGSRSHDWSFSHPYMYDPEVLDLIRRADEVYVFPIATPLKPHRDDKHMRLLVDPARREIMRLLGKERNWYQGHYSLIAIEPEPTNVGLVFRRGKNELVLFFSGEGFAEGSFNGQYVADPLQDEPGKNSLSGLSVMLRSSWLPNEV